jgi:hypothetical protein
LLRHVVQQVFGNLRAAARITILPVLLGYGLCFAIALMLLGADDLALFTQADEAATRAPGPDEVTAFALAFLGVVALCFPILLVCYSWAAVGWHRYVLLEEYPSGFAAHWRGGVVGSYVWAIVRLGLMFAGVLVLLVIVLSILGPVLSQNPGSLLFLNFSLGIGLTWLAARLGLILPASALGGYMKLGESWAFTKPAASAILLPILIVPIAFFVVNFVLGLVPVIGFFLLLVSIWLQMLVNLALMTTLYGNLVEGRQLN